VGTRLVKASPGRHEVARHLDTKLARMEPERAAQTIHAAGYRRVAKFLRDVCPPTGG